MADSILRLKVDSQEYDQKIKRAAEGIQQYAQKCREAGGTLQYLDDGVLEFVQALGKMDTVATGTKQQLREMSNALTTLTQTYRGLTDEEKASPFGQELAKGIQQLTERAGQAQDAMADVQASIRNAASDTRLFDQMAQGMSVATAGFQGLTGAGKLLGIEMGNDVEVIAKLQAAMAVTNSLTTIQTALQKQSALMQGLNAAKTSLAVVAQQAYAVATGEATVAQAAFNVAANANPYALIITAAAAAATAIYAYCEATDDAEEKQKALNIQLENAKTQMEGIKTDSDFNVAIAKAAGESENAIRKMRLEAARARLALADLTLDQVTAPGSGATKEQIKQAQDASQAAWKEVKKVLDEMTIAEVERLNKLKMGPEVVITPNHKTPTKTPKATKVSKEPSIEDIINEQFPDIAQAESVGQSYGEQITEGILVGMAEKAQTADVTTLKTLMETTIKNGIEGVDIPADELMSKIIGDGADIPDETWQKLQDEINAKLAEMGIEPIKINFETGNLEKVVKDTKTTTKEWNAAATAISAVGNAMKQIEDPAAKVMGTIAQAIATIALSYAQALSRAASAGPWAWIAFAGTGLATMISTISAIHSSTGYANGGVISGNSYSGDNILGQVNGGGLVGLNSGEMVLSKQQQMILAGTLENGGMRDINVRGYLKGEDLMISIDRTGRRQGRGELAFFK